MSPPRAAPPAADPCLDKLCASSSAQKGGTIIDETAPDLASHLRKLFFPDECRPAACRCGADCLHVHDRRDRHPRQLVVDGQPVVVVTIMVFLCAACSATWRVLPAFLARHLWRTWNVIERETLGEPRGTAPPVPRRTVQRWRARLAQAARLPVQALVVAGGALRKIAEQAGPDATRKELLLSYGGSFASLALLLHRLAPGVRLM